MESMKGVLEMYNTSIKQKIVSKSAFEFIGIGEETNNELEMKGDGVIPKLWAEFYQKGIQSQIPNKSNESTIALYTNYESDETGTYSFAIGTQVDDGTNPPEGMKVFSVEASKYVVFTTRQGRIPDVIVEAWQFIWEWSKSNERAFTSDFELYDHRAADPNNAQVDIYISVK